MCAAFGRSWRLLKTTWNVLRQDKELTTFPVLASILTILISIVFFLLALALGIRVPGMDGRGRGGDFNLLGLVALFFYYLVISMVVNYMAAALTAAVLIRIRGGDPTVQDGFKAANSRLGKLFIWSLITATVGMVLQMVRNQARKSDNIAMAIIASLLASLAEFAWEVASFLTIPIIVDEDKQPLEALKGSVAYLKKTWGEQIIGGAGLSLALGLISFGIALLGLLIGGLFGAMGFNLGVVAAIVVVVIAIAVVSVIGGTLGGVFRALVYQYAKTGTIPTMDGVESALISGAFKPKGI